MQINNNGENWLNHFPRLVRRRVYKNPDGRRSIRCEAQLSSGGDLRE